MSSLLEEVKREWKEEVIESLTGAEELKLLKGISADEQIKGMSDKKLEKPAELICEQQEN